MRILKQNVILRLLNSYLVENQIAQNILLSKQVILLRISFTALYLVILVLLRLIKFNPLFWVAFLYVGLSLLIFPFAINLLGVFVLIFIKLLNRCPKWSILNKQVKKILHYFQTSLNNLDLTTFAPVFIIFICFFIFICKTFCLDLMNIIPSFSDLNPDNIYLLWAWAPILSIKNLYKNLKTKTGLKTKNQTTLQRSEYNPLPSNVDLINANTNPVDLKEEDKVKTFFTNDPQTVEPVSVIKGPGFFKRMGKNLEDFAVFSAENRPVKTLKRAKAITPKPRTIESSNNLENPQNLGIESWNSNQFEAEPNLIVPNSNVSSAIMNVIEETL
jgi:hypothetical protein